MKSVHEHSRGSQATFIVLCYCAAGPTATTAATATILLLLISTYHGVHSGGEIRVLRQDAQLGHIHTLKGLVSCEGGQNGGVDAPADPHKHVVAVLHQEDAVARQALVGQVHDLWQAHLRDG
jgi:hypothetical protein